MLLLLLLLLLSFCFIKNHSSLSIFGNSTSTGTREMALMPAGTVSLILNDYIHVRIQIEVFISKESFLSHLSTLLEFHEKKVFFTLEKLMLKISTTSNLYFLVVCFLQCFYLRFISLHYGLNSNDATANHAHCFIFLQTTGTVSIKSFVSIYNFHVLNTAYSIFYFHHCYWCRLGNDGSYILQDTLCSTMLDDAKPITCHWRIGDAISDDITTYSTL